MSSYALVIVPTRGRPDNAMRLFNQFAETCTADTELIFAVDDDDPKRDEYLKMLSLGARVETGPRLRLAGTLNALAMKYCQSYDVLGFMGDDHLPQQTGWDRKIMDTILDVGRGAVVYGNDLFQGPNLPTAWFMDADIVRIMGYMVPTTLKHMYLDNAVMTYGQRLGTLRYRDDIIIEHMHPQAGKSEIDEGYEDVWQLMDPDAAAWHDYVATKLEFDIARLKENL